MTIYTKRGDGGKTGMFISGKSGKDVRVYKDSLKVRVLGSLDELNSILGVTISFSNIPEITLYLKEVQKNLFTIGSITAGSNLRFSALQTKKLEKIIDDAEKRLPALTEFILPGGNVFASHLHYARSVARRAERMMVALSRKEGVKPQILGYLNRLSDFLFILARLVNLRAGIKEEIWSIGHKGKS